MQSNEASLTMHGHMAARNFKWRVARTYAADSLLQVSPFVFFSGAACLICPAAC